MITIWFGLTALQIWLFWLLGCFGFADDAVCFLDFVECLDDANSFCLYLGVTLWVWIWDCVLLACLGVGDLLDY